MEGPKLTFSEIGLEDENSNIEFEVMNRDEWRDRQAEGFIICLSPLSTYRQNSNV